MTAQPLLLAMVSPLDQSLGDVVKAWWPVVVTVGGGLLAWLVKARKVWRKEREEQRLQGKSIRYLLDENRHVLRALLMSQIHDHELYDELLRQKTLIDGVRDELWVHDGHESMRSTERIAESLTRTMRIQLKTERIRPIDGAGEDHA